MATTPEGEEAGGDRPSGTTSQPSDPMVVLLADNNDHLHFNNELLFAMSSILHIQKHSPKVPPECADNQRRTLELLDGIALLLVTDDKADVAAASFEHTSGGFLRQKPPLHKR
jgi:hypothetical protein